MAVVAAPIQKLCPAYKDGLRPALDRADIQRKQNGPLSIESCRVSGTGPRCLECVLRSNP